MPDSQPGAQTRPAWPRDLIVRIHADTATVFALLRDVKRWPLIFDHSNAVRVVKQSGARRLFVVRASWYGPPVGWRAIQTVEPELGRIHQPADQRQHRGLGRAAAHGRPGPPARL